MKRLFFILMLAIAACNVNIPAVQAQDQEMMQKAMARYKNMETLTADVHQTKHNALVTKDVTADGKFYFKKPSTMVLKLNGGKDAMIMNGDTFTMVTDGKANTASGKGNSQLSALTTALKAFSAGEQSDVDLSDVADVDVTQKGNLVEMVITPIITDPKAKRKMMFQSFVLVLDKKAGELRSLRLNEKGQNYTLYEFSNFKLNVPISSAEMSVKGVDLK